MPEDNHSELTVQLNRVLWRLQKALMWFLLICAPMLLSAQLAQF